MEEDSRGGGRFEGAEDSRRAVEDSRGAKDSRRVSEDSRKAAEDSRGGGKFEGGWIASRHRPNSTRVEAVVWSSLQYNVCVPG